MNKPHRHAELIKAWADGKEIELCLYGIWYPLKSKSPAWDNEEYRIKPEPPAKVYPVTGMSSEELYEIYRQAAQPISPFGGFKNVANAAIRHAVDSGQLVEPAKIDRIEPDAFSPLMEAAKEQRAARDMAIAMAVKTACMRASLYGGQFNSISGIYLPAIIASVKE